MTAPVHLPSASLIVLNWNGRELLTRCLPSVLAQEYPEAEVLVVDNGSTDGSLEWLASAYPQVRLLPQGRNLGYAGGMNAGLRVAQGELIAFLNNDVILRPDWLRQLAGVMVADRRIGVAGCKLLYPEGNLIQHAGGILRYPLALPDHYGFRQPDTGQFDAIRDVDYVTGAAFVARREMLDQIGAFDEGFYFYFEDTDLCFRARAAGWRVVVVPQAVATHLESATAVRDSPSYYTLFHRGRLHFVLKHYTPQQFLEDFLPAERARWPEGIAADEREPLRQAYRETARHLNAILSARPGPAQGTEIHPATIERIRQGLYDLAALAASRPIDALIDSLYARATLREHVFVSHVPIIGPLIGRFRALWNSVSTRWYVLPLAAQQSEFNTLVSQALEEQQVRLEEMQASLALTSQALEAMQANLIALDRQMTALTRRVAIAERQWRPDGDQHLADQGDVPHPPDTAP